MIACGFQCRRHYYSRYSNMSTFWPRIPHTWVPTKRMLEERRREIILRLSLREIVLTAHWDTGSSPVVPGFIPGPTGTVRPRLPGDSSQTPEKATTFEPGRLGNSVIHQWEKSKFYDEKISFYIDKRSYLCLKFASFFLLFRGGSFTDSCSSLTACILAKVGIAGYIQNFKKKTYFCLSLAEYEIFVRSPTEPPNTPKFATWY